MEFDPPTHHNVPSGSINSRRAAWCRQVLPITPEKDIFVRPLTSGENAGTQPRLGLYGRPRTRAAFAEISQTNCLGIWFLLNFYYLAAESYKTFRNFERMYTSQHETSPQISPLFVCDLLFNLRTLCLLPSWKVTHRLLRGVKWRLLSFWGALLFAYCFDSPSLTVLPNNAGNAGNHHRWCFPERIVSPSRLPRVTLHYHHPLVIICVLRCC